jgi:hypothetical protein
MTDLVRFGGTQAQGFNLDVNQGFVIPFNAVVDTSGFAIPVDPFQGFQVPAERMVAIIEFEAIINTGALGYMFVNLVTTGNQLLELWRGDVSNLISDDTLALRFHKIIVLNQNAVNNCVGHIQVRYDPEEEGEVGAFQMDPGYMLTIVAMKVDREPFAPNVALVPHLGELPLANH